MFDGCCRYILGVCVSTTQRELTVRAVRQVSTQSHGLLGLSPMSTLVKVSHTPHTWRPATV